MRDTCQVQLACPEMRIESLPGGLHRTASEPMVCTVTIIGGAGPALDMRNSWEGEAHSPTAVGIVRGDLQLKISPVTIPPTLTRPDPELPLVWWVDVCVGEGNDGGRKVCPQCGGEGQIQEYDPATGYKPYLTTCPTCGGKGYIEEGVGNRIRVELPRERVNFRWISTDGEHWDFWHIIRAFEGGWMDQEERSQLANGKWSIALIAEAIDAPTTLWLADGRIFKGSVTFPPCKVLHPLISPVAEAVTATGELSLVQS